MHKEAIHFINTMKDIFNEYFISKKVLDVGGGDINGNNRGNFNNCEYYCNDVVNSPNVNIVSKTKDLQFENNIFDTIISTECFEHDPEYEESLKKIYNLLKPNGLFLFTCASIGRPEHGTRKSKPHQSYGTIAGLEDMQDYYKNLSEYDINKVLDCKNNFLIYKTYYNTFSKDLYFIGIKNSDNNSKINKEIIYNNTYIIDTTDLSYDYNYIYKK